MIGGMLETKLLIKNLFQLSGLWQKFNSYNSVSHICEGYLKKGCNWRQIVLNKNETLEGIIIYSEIEEDIIYCILSQTWGYWEKSGEKWKKIYLFGFEKKLL